VRQAADRPAPGRGQSALAQRAPPRLAPGRGPSGPARGPSAPVQRAPPPVLLEYLALRKGVNNIIKIQKVNSTLGPGFISPRKWETNVMYGRS
jgi:hypothetical protein